MVTHLIDQVKKLVHQAGAAILAVYHDPAQNRQVDYKADDSPLTLADAAANRILVAGLQAIAPEIPVLSEEKKHQPYDERQRWQRFWLVDPLDGTKEFINRNGEFTVNVALIDQGRPVAGVVYVPVKNIMYWADERGAFKEENNRLKPLAVRQAQSQRIAVRSKSHASPEEEEVLTRYEVVDSIAVGSSLKFCMVAEGKADIYYRHGPTMEWDTAAGQAIVEAAGGKVYIGNRPGQHFRYNKENLLNSSFLCLGFDHE